MKKLFKLLLWVVSFLLLSAFIRREPIPSYYKPFYRLVHNDSISFNAQGLGGHRGECIEISSSCKINDSLYVHLTPGTRFISDDTSFQDLLVVRDELISFSGKEGQSVKAYAFCCQAYKKSPLKNAFFSKVEKADDKLISLADYISKYSFSDDLIQDAIWTVSDGNPVASIYDANDEPRTQRMRKFVARLLGEEVPFYTITYKKDSSLFSGIPDRIVGEFDYRIFNLCMVDIRLVDKAGNVIKVYKNGEPHQPRTYTFLFDEDASTLERGTYFIKVYFDRALRYEKKIEI